jgi:hypothetical protein
MRLEKTLTLPMAAAITAGLLGIAAGPLLAQNPAATIAVDANANRLAINPMIYGVSWPSAGDYAALNLPIARAGGEAQSNYNWQINATNLCQDWYWESYPSASATPDGVYDDFVNAGRATGTQSMLTLPMLGYIAKLGPNRSILPSFSIAKYGAQTGHDPWDTDAGSGVSASTGKNITGNNVNDAYVPNSAAIQQAWVQHLLTTFGTASNGGVRYYIMDNEPSIWSSVHRDMHPVPETYDELYNDYVTYALLVRNADPNAIIVGPEEWGWWAEFLSGRDQTGGSGSSGPDYTSHGNTYYYPWLLQQLAAYQKSTGKQLLNVLSAHYYPAETSSSDDSASAQAIRNASTRALWDPNYVDPSWLNQVGINGGIVKLIPQLKGWVSQYYPGLQTAITEYNWGDEANLNGATTQADVLGIFGKYGLDIATRWEVPANPSPTYLAMQIYRNYDGSKSTFGDTSVSCGVANPDKLSSFAAVRARDGALTVMVINKITGSTPVTISLANFAASSSAQAWQISSASQTAISHLANVAVSGNQIVTTVPGQSITLLVVPPAATQSAPSTPTNVKATAGNTTATVTWNAVSGAASYSVYRGTSPGAERATAWKTGITGLLFTNTGLTNGTTYYYKVTAVNSAGESPKSAEVSVTPTSGAPAAPTGVVATAGNTTATITWNAVSGATSYSVYRGTSPGAERATAWKTGITKLLFTNTGLTNGTTYYYKVTAVNTAGESPMSTEVHATPAP